MRRSSFRSGLLSPNRIDDAAKLVLNGGAFLAALPNTKDAPLDAEGAIGRSYRFAENNASVYHVSGKSSERGLCHIFGNYPFDIYIAIQISGVG